MNVKNTFCTKFYYEPETTRHNTYAVQFYIYTFLIVEKASITNLRVYIDENNCELYYLDHL